VDDFDAVVESQEAKLFADQIGAFEAHPAADDKDNMVMRQMVPALPIGWSDHGSNGPMSLIGMREWQDTALNASFRLPLDAPAGAAGCVASRIDQMWRDGFALCVYTTGNWSLSVGGPSQATGQPTAVIASGKTPVAVAPGRWHSLALTVVGGEASGSLDGHTLFTSESVRTLDTGFAGIGSNAWYGPPPPAGCYPQRTRGTGVVCLRTYTCVLRHMTLVPLARCSGSVNRTSLMLAQPRRVCMMLKSIGRGGVDTPLPPPLSPPLLLFPGSSAQARH